VELLSNTETHAVIVADYSAQELAIQPGEEVTVEHARHDWLLVRNARGVRLDPRFAHILERWFWAHMRS
jgi:hypothetical protein